MVVFGTSGNVFTLVIFNCLSLCVYSSELCVTHKGPERCDYGCCDSKCCGFPLALIVPIIIGGMIVLGLVISLAVCVYCVCKKPTVRRGNVVQPQNINTVSVHSTYGNAPPIVNPPSYNQATSYPGSSSQFDAAYPPGTAIHPPPVFTYSKPTAK